MRTLGGWIALTPELDGKLLFGRHVWDCAQHADLWGRRLPELRALAQQSEPASAAVLELMDRVQSTESPSETLERVTAVYRVIKPHLATVYERHLAVTNPVYEPPTRRILERCVQEERRHAAAGGHVLARLLARDPGLQARADEYERGLVDALTAAGGIAGDVEPPVIVPPAVPPDPATVAQDLVAPPPAFDPRAALGDLGATLDAHRRALAAGDVEALERDVDPDLAAALARLGGSLVGVDVVGCARLGGHRVVKLHLRGAGGTTVLQERWVPSAPGWRLMAIDILTAMPGS
jgi:hypothetical protein